MILISALLPMLYYWLVTKNIKPIDKMTGKLLNKCQFNVYNKQLYVKLIKERNSLDIYFIIFKMNMPI